MLKRPNYIKLTIVNLLFLTIVTNGTAQDNTKQLFNKAYYLLSVDRSAAIDYLTSCIDQDSTFRDAYYHRGIAYFKEAKYDSALLDFDRAFELDPELAIIWMYKGFTYRNLGELDLALDSFSNYILTNPQDTSAYSYILRGKMKYELGDFNGAVEDYDMAVKLKPLEEKYQYYRFIALNDSGHFREALKAVDRLIEINPSFYGYYFYKGRLFQEMNQHDSAIFMFNIAIIKNYSNPDSYFYRALAFEQLGDLSKALEDYNTSIVLKPEEGTYYSRRGHCKFALGNKAGACEDWNEAGSLGYFEDFDRVKKVCE